MKRVARAFVVAACGLLLALAAMTGSAGATAPGTDQRPGS
jgi:hypothetical protein